jgi:hypothetical protein
VREAGQPTSAQPGSRPLVSAHRPLIAATGVVESDQLAGEMRHFGDRSGRPAGPAKGAASCYLARPYSIIKAAAKLHRTWK